MKVAARQPESSGNPVIVTTLHDLKSIMKQAVAEAIAEGKVEANDQTQGERLHRPNAVADRLSMGRTFVSRLIESGEMRSLKLGGARRIPESAVVEYLQSLSGN